VTFHQNGTGKELENQYKNKHKIDFVNNNL